MLIRTIRYKNYTAKVSGEKPVECSCCRKEAKPRGLHCHHTKYAYTVDEVRKNPELAKENTIYLCYACHLLANARRKLQENPMKNKKLEKLEYGI